MDFHMDDSSKERFTPRSTIDHYTSRHNISVDDIGVAPVVVISWWRNVVTPLAEKIGARTPTHWIYGQRQPFFTGQISGRSISLLQAPVGAPGTVMIMEELIACGAHTFLGLGWAGSLQPHAPIGTLLIPTSCVREEGTSFHYLDGSEELAPPGWMVRLLRRQAEKEGSQIVAGPLWTTDAPYRELVSKINTYAEQGVLGVDMETSAMYALGRFRDVRVCNLLVVSDELWHEWHPAFETTELNEATQLAQRIILRCLEDDCLFD